jgi:hypothetical protein
MNTNEECRCDPTKQHLPFEISGDLSGEEVQRRNSTGSFSQGFIIPNKQESSSSGRGNSITNKEKSNSSSSSSSFRKRTSPVGVGESSKRVSFNLF